MKQFWTARLVAVAIAACFIGAANATPMGTSSVQSLLVNGLERTYIVHVPASYDGSNKVPLVLALHPAGTDAAFMERLTGWDKIADAEDVIVAYPNSLGTPRAWNAGYVWAPGMGDDISFLRMLVIALQADYKVDPTRIYATGFSSGAMMTYRLGAQLSATFAAIAPVSGAIGRARSRLFAPYVPDRPISVISIHGTADQIIPYSGGWSVAEPEAAKLWALADGCTISPSGPNATNPDLQITDYTGGAAGTEVKFYARIGAGHVYAPGTTDLIWQFFKKHPKAQSAL